MSRAAEARAHGMLESEVAGIPCLVHVTCYYEQPALGRGADNDQDARGYTDIEFDLYDRKGYRAKWLEAKLTDADVAYIEAIIKAAKPQEDPHGYPF